MSDMCRIIPGPPWGLALAWYDAYTDGKKDPLSKMDFLSRYGMTAFSLTYAELADLDGETRDLMYQRISDERFTVATHFSTDFVFNDAIDSAEFTDTLLENIDRYTEALNCSIITTTLGKSHRYDRLMPFEEKIQRFSAALTPIAQACSKAGAPMAIENHADYYVSEIVDIIVATPGSYLFFDTANALHIGEQPVKAAMDAAPYTLGTHFKDHSMVKGESGPVHYVVSGCALGEGDADLARVYKILMKKCPNKDRLVMLFELFKGDEPALDCFEKSVRFVRTLQDTYGV